MRTIIQSRQVLVALALGLGQCSPPRPSTSPTDERPTPAPERRSPVSDELGELQVDDLCPDDPERRNGFEDDDGCPDELMRGHTCEDGGLAVIGGTLGEAPSLGCMTGFPESAEVTLTALSDPAIPRALVDAAGRLPARARGPLARWLAGPLETRRFTDAAGLPLRHPDVVLRDARGATKRLRGGTDGRVVLVPGWDGSPPFEVTLVERAAASDKRHGVDVAVLVDPDPELAGELLALRDTLPGVLEAIARSHGDAELRWGLIALGRADARVIADLGDPGEVLDGLRDLAAELSAMDRTRATGVGLAAGLRAADHLSWARQGARDIVLLARRSPEMSRLRPTLDAVDLLRSHGVRIVPIIGRAPSVEDELALRLLAAVTGGESRRRSHWGDFGIEIEEAFPCAFAEGIEASLVRLLRSELNGRPIPPIAGMVRAGPQDGGGSCRPDEGWMPVGVTRSLQPAFRPGDATLDPRAGFLLDRPPLVLRELPQLHVRVTGHSDDRELPRAEQRRDLSRRRAEEVARALRDRGVPDARMTIVGEGDSRPRTTNETSEGRSRNRRVEPRAASFVDRRRLARAARSGLPGGDRLD